MRDRGRESSPLVAIAGLSGGALFLTLTLACAALVGPPHPPTSTTVSLDLPTVSGAESVPVEAFLAPDPRAPAGASLDQAIERCASGESMTGYVPSRLALLSARAGEGIVVGGTPVGALDADGRASAGELKGHLHAPLYDELLTMAEAHREVGAALGACAPWGPAAPFEGRILLALDAGLPYETVRVLLYTAGQAQYGEFYVVVDDPSARPSTRFVGQAQGRPDTTVDGAAGAQGGLELAPIVTVEQTGLRLSHRSLAPEGVALPCASGFCSSGADYRVQELRDALVGIRDEAGTRQAIIVGEGAATWDGLARVMAAVRTDPRGEPLFSRITLASSAPDGGASVAGPVPSSPVDLVLDPAGRVAALPAELPSLPTAIANPEPSSQDLLGGLSGKLGSMGTRGTSGGSGGFRDSSVGTIGGDPIILGALDRSHIDAVVRRHMNQLRYCYERALADSPSVQGKVVIKFVIAKDGSVSSADTKSSTLDSPGVDACLESRFERMQFPEPKGGGIVIVSYPFFFSPG